MKKSIQSFTMILIMLFLSASGFSQISNYVCESPNQNGTISINEYGPQGNIYLQSGKGYPWDLQFEYSILSYSNGHAGIETDGNSFYIPLWDSDTIYRFGMTGTYIEKFVISGVSAIRDLAWDGTYFYGGAGGDTIYKLNLVTKQLISKIAIPTGVGVRHIAYDPIDDALWIGNWSTDIYQVNKLTGVFTDTIPNVATILPSIYGSAFDTVSPNGPYIWVFSQGGNGCLIGQIDVATALPTGLIYDIYNDMTIQPGAIAGGLFIHPNIVTGTFTLGGLVQNNRIFGYDLASTQPDSIDIGVVELLSPQNNYDLSNSETVQIVVQNHGITAVSSYNVAYSIDGDTAVTQSVTTSLAAFDKDTISFTTMANLSVIGSYDFQLYTILANDMDHNNDTLQLNVSHLAPIVVTQNSPYFQSWENGIYDWVQSTTDTIDWTLNSGSTPSSGTGPTAAIDSNFYIYTEMSGPPTGASAEIWAPFDFTNAPTPMMSFYYHMNGTSMGSFFLDVNGGSSWVNGFWSKTGDQGSSWIKDTIDLSAYADSSNVTLRFRAVRGTNWSSDIAIDLVEVYQPILPDAGISLIVYPPVVGNKNIDVYIKNYGSDTITNVNVQWIVDTTVGTTHNWSGILLPGDSTGPVTIGTYNFTAGGHMITAWTESPNNQIDGDNLNDTLIVSDTSFFPINSFPYCESFESGFADWKQSSEDDTDWTWDSNGTPTNSTGPSSAYDGTYYLYLESSSPVALGDEAYLTTYFDLTNISDPILSFYYNMNGDGMGTLHLDIRKDSVWFPDVWSISGNQGTSWHSKEILLSAFGGSSEVWIRFRAEAGDTSSTAGPVYRSDMAIDLVCISSLPANDAGIIEILSLQPYCGMGNEYVDVLIKNYGADTISNFELAYQVNAANPVTDTFTSFIAPLDTASFSFTVPIDMSVPGVYDVTLFTKVNGDTVYSNDTMMQTVIHVYHLSEDTIDFENPHQAMANVIFQANAESQAFIDTVAGNNSILGAVLTGKTNTDYTTPSAGNEWTINESHSAKLSFCIDATALTSLRLKFDMKQTYTYNPQYSNFRILINGNQVGNTYRPNSTVSDPYFTHILSLDSMAGSSFTLTFETRNKYDIINGNNEGDNAYIDNVIFMLTPQIDARLISIDGLTSGCGLSDEDVTIKINNFGKAVIYPPIPVSYIVDAGVTSSESCTDTILPGDTISYTFSNQADLSSPGSHQIIAYVYAGSDSEPLNDTAFIDVYNTTAQVPFAMGFEPGEDMSSWAVINNNNDNRTWYYSTSGNNPNTGVGYAYYAYSDTLAADDWLISQCIELISSETYALRFFYKVRDAGYPEKLELKMGTDQTVNAMTTTIIDFDTISNDTYLEYSTTISVSSDGYYYFGWHAYSDANMYNLYVDDFSIDVNTGMDNYIDEGLNVKLYPVPAKEELFIESNNSVINEIYIYNAMGQKVFSGIHNTNHCKVNTSDLRSGMYFIEIRIDKQVLLEKIVIE
ncbi:choice-of-anchor J domain-containing protein [Bacteroidota bacterium]